MKKLIVLMLFASFALSQSFMIGVAGGYKKPIMQIVNNAKKDGIDIEPIFGHPKQMVAQAKYNDLSVIIGDKEFLTTQKDVKIINFITLGEGVLVFVSNKKINNINDIVNLNKIAIAQPKKTIYGLSATEFLNNTNLMPSIKDKIIEVSSVPQVSTYIKSGDIDGGFINLTEAIAQKGNFATQIFVDKSKYNVPTIVAAELKNCNENCKKFLKYLQNDKSKKILKDYGL